MPIFKLSAGQQPANPLQLSFVERLRAGRVVPVISDEATFDLALARATGTAGPGLRRLYRLPDARPRQPGQDDQILQTAGDPRQEGLKEQELKADYLNYVKNHVYYLAQAAGAGADLLAEAGRGGRPDGVRFCQPPGLSKARPRAGGSPVGTGQPADQGLSHHQPLHLPGGCAAPGGQAPRTELCRWRRELDSIDPAIDQGYQPSAREPLVYHLHGLDTYPDSLVLTEDDHLEFLVNICQGQGNESADRVHGLVRKALFDDLILLGFSLSGWPFRVLYTGLIKPNGRQEDRGICCLQLVPGEDEKRYLEDYLQREARFDVFWGDVPQYTRELRRMFKE